MNFYMLRSLFHDLIPGIRRTNAAHNASVSTRQVVRARLRAARFIRVGCADICDTSRKDRRAVSRAKAAGAFKAQKGAAK